MEQAMTDQNITVQHSQHESSPSTKYAKVLSVPSLDEREGHWRVGGGLGVVRARPPSCSCLLTFNQVRSSSNLGAFVRIG